MDIGLARIEPPCVGADLREAVLDLPPVDRPRLGRIGIVIGVQIARPDPVLVPVIEIAAIGIALRRQLLVVLGRRVEFRPDRDHEARVHVVDLVDHLLRLREALGVELVTAPRVFGPVEPVLDDVIERDLQVAVLLDDVDDLTFRVVTLARLPEAVRPFRHHHGLAGERAIAGDDLVHVLAGHVPIVDRLRDIAGEPHRMAIGRGERIVVEQRDIACVRLPLDPHRDALALGHRQVEVRVPGIPVLAPAVEHFLAVRKHLEIARAVELELVHAADVGRHVAGPHNLLRLDRVTRGVLATGRGDRLRLGGGGPLGLILDILVVDRRFLLRHRQPIAEIILRGEAGLALARHLQAIGAHQRIGPWVTEAGDAVVVPQQPVVARRDDERDGDVHVVLREFDVLAVVIHLRILMLAEAVQPLIGAAVELLRGDDERLAIRGGGKECGVRRLLEHDLASRIEEADSAGLQIDFGGIARRRDQHAPALLRDGERTRDRRRRHHQAWHG